MAMDAEQFEALAFGVAQGELHSQFPDTPTEILDGLATAVAKTAATVIEYIQSEADVAGVTEGSDTVQGAIV